MHLSGTTQELLRDIRRISTEHETRRAAILNELQGLAGTIGAPTAR